MRRSCNRLTTLSCFLPFLVCLSGSPVVAAILIDWPENNYPNPNPPRAVGVFMANGIFDANDASYTPPTFDDFETVIMGRDQAAKDARRQEAVDFFMERYGVDFSQGDVAQNGAIILATNVADPRWNYRCYRLPGRWIPRAGFIVHDANYAMAVISPNGATLFGTWGGDSGTQVNFGSVAVDGEYLIQGTNRFRRGHWRNVYMRFRTVDPIENALSGNIKFNCKVGGAYLGDGAAVGRQEVYQLGSGLTQVAIQNVLQFPAPEWIREREGDD